MGMPQQPQLDPKLMKMLMARRAYAKQQQGMPEGTVSPEEFDALDFGEEDPNDPSARHLAQGDQMGMAFESQGQMFNQGMPMDSNQVEMGPGYEGQPIPEQGGMPGVGSIGDEDPFSQNIAEIEQAQFGPQPSISKDKENMMFKYGAFHATMMQMGGGGPQA